VHISRLLRDSTGAAIIRRGRVKNRERFVRVKECIVVLMTINVLRESFGLEI
jgi:hypothetical protein